MTERVALYYAPDAHDPLWIAGSAWLGQDAITGQSVERPAKAPSDPVARPAVYGFHATLKPPFRIRDGMELDQLLAAAGIIAAATPPFPLSRLRVELLGSYMALTLAEPCALLAALSGRLVTELDGFRAPMTTAELARRRSVPLSATQQVMLQRWGYPDVLSEWRFHMTLSERLTPDRAGPCLAAAQDFFAPALAMKRQVEAVCVFRQPAEGSSFRLCHHIALGRGRP